MTTRSRIAIFAAGLRRTLPAGGFAARAVKIVFEPDAPKPVPVAVSVPPVGKGPHSR